MQSILRRIVDEVIGHRRARSFLLPRALEKHPMIQRLFDARVIHHMQRGYADKDNPGVRYNIYTLDYGTYVDLIGTSKQPQLTLDDMAIDQTDIVVPFDDKRSIRRIVLTEQILDLTGPLQIQVKAKCVVIRSGSQCSRVARSIAQVIVLRKVSRNTARQASPMVVSVVVAQSCARLCRN